jgi:hypothetical protein
MKKTRWATVLTVDAGPHRRAPARFYRLVVGRPADTVREDLLVPDGAELRTAHRHEASNHDEPTGRDDLDDAA